MDFFKLKVLCWSPKLIMWIENREPSTFKGELALDFTVIRRVVRQKKKKKSL